MGLGFKYHVVTIAAIFFALTIGLVVGSLYVSPRVPQTTVRAIENLQKSQAALDKNNQDLKQERDVLQNTLRQALPYALKGRLSGQTVAIVQSGGGRNVAADVRDILMQAGAQIASTTTLEHLMEQPDELLLPRLAALRVNDPRYPADREGLAARLSNVFQKGETTANEIMALFQNAGLVRFDSDSSFTQPIRTLVLLTGSASEASALAANVDVPLISALQKDGITVYACETQDAGASSFPTYRAANLQVSTIERIDTDAGRWQLVSTLAAPAP